jgi:hypothetical protein
LRIWVNEEEQTFLKELRAGEKDQKSMLQDEADAVGIDVKDIRHYWFKSKKFSINVRGATDTKTYNDLRDEIIKAMDEHSPVYPAIKREKQKEGHLLVVDLSDIHINKLADPANTNEPYTTEIAVQRSIEGTKGLLDKSNGFNIEKILFVIGNDVLNTDNVNKTTPRGTPQDTDVHWYTAFERAREVYVACINMCLKVADVDVIHCPSNHDEMSSCFLADSLKSWYRKSNNVSFQIGAKYRKYYKYHSNMIELEHGDKGKMANVPLIMAQEQPKMWGETKYRYSYLHHVHHSDKTQFKSGKDYIGVNVTYLRSPSNPDLWHESSGYINTVAVEAFIHSKDRGRVAHLTNYF